MQLSLVSQLGSEKTRLTLEDFEEEMKLLDTDEMVQCLMDLSILEMCLVIAMKHHIEIYDNQAMNFEMIFTRYLKFVNANSNVQTVQRPVVMKAFEHLKVNYLITIIIYIQVCHYFNLDFKYKIFCILCIGKLLKLFLHIQGF